MAKIDLKHLDCLASTDYIQVILDEEYIEKDEDCIKITSVEDGVKTVICLDKSTAIKFAKTLRTEINKIKY